MRVLMIVCVCLAVWSAGSTTRAQRLQVAGSDEHLWVLQTRRVDHPAPGEQVSNLVTLLHRQRSDPAGQLQRIETLRGELATYGWAAADNQFYLLFTDQLVKMVSVNPSSLGTGPVFQGESFASFPGAVNLRAWSAGSTGPWALVQVSTAEALDAIDAPPTAPKPQPAGGANPEQDLYDMALNLPPGVGIASSTDGQADQTQGQGALPTRSRRSLPADRLIKYARGRWQPMELPNDWPQRGTVWLVMRRSSDLSPLLLTVQGESRDKSLWVYERVDESWVKRTYPVRGSSAIGAASVSGQLVIAEPTDVRDALEVSLSVLRIDGLTPLGSLRVEATPTSAWAIAPVGMTVALIVETDYAGAQPVDPNVPDPGRLGLAITRMNLLGQVVQEPTPMRRRVVSKFDRVADWIVLLSVLGLSVLMLMVFWRHDPRMVKLELPPDTALADLGKRAAAGVIDLFPAALISMTVYGVNALELFAMHWPGVGFGADWFSMAPGATTIGIFVAHTMVGELFTHRSIGKAVMRLRVTDTLGRPLKAWQIIVRGLLKAFDLVAFFLLLLPMIGPFRQRLGDLVAQTVVVMPAPAGEKDEQDHDGGDDDE